MMKVVYSGTKSPSKNIEALMCDRCPLSTGGQMCTETASAVLHAANVRGIHTIEDERLPQIIARGIIGLVGLSDVARVACRANQQHYDKTVQRNAV